MNFWFKLAKWRFNTFSQNRKDFYEDFAMALRDNAATIDQLNTMAMRSRRRRTGWAALYEHWIKKMRRMSFGYALQHTVPTFESMVLTAAEEDGRISEAMDYLVRSIELTGKIKNIYFISLASPMISILVIIGFLISYATVTGPEYLQIMPFEQWPTLTKSIYFVSNGLYQNGVSFIVASIITVALIFWSRPNWYGRWRKFFERIPLNPWSSYRYNESNNFLIALSILLQSNNHGTKDALEMMRKFSSPWMAWHINVMLKRLKLTPDRPEMAMDTGLFDNHVMDRIEDYANRSEFNSAIYKLAFSSGEKFVKTAQIRAIVIGVLAMLIVASCILLMAASNIQFSQAANSLMKSM